MHEIYNILFDHIINNKTSNKTLKNQWEKIIMLLNATYAHIWPMNFVTKKLNEILLAPI